MHPLNTDTNYQNFAFASNTAQIKARVEIHAVTYLVTGFDANGTVQYDNTQTENQFFDVSEFVMNKPLTLNKSFNPMPNLSGEGELLQYGEISVQISMNPQTQFLAYISKGGGILQLRKTIVKISALYPNGEIKSFEGLITGLKEANKSITYQVRPSMWDLVKKDLYMPYSQTRAWVDLQGNMHSNTNTHYPNQSRPHINISFSHPSLHYTAFGAEAFSVKASDPDIVDLLEIQLSGLHPARLGLVKVSFEKPNLWKIECPNLNFDYNLVPLSGAGVHAIVFTATQIQASGIEKIILRYNLPNATDIKGKAIETWLCYNATGNPISIALDLISRALQPQNLLVSTPLPMTSDKVDYASFLQLEELFATYVFHVTEGNKDNVAWNDYRQKPLQVKNVVGKLLSQMGCQLIYNSKGQISVRSNWYNATNLNIHQLTSAYTSASGVKEEMHALTSEKEYASMAFRYAYDWFTEKYITSDLVFQDTFSDEKERYDAYFPYIKIGNEILIHQLSTLMWNLVRLQHVRLEMQVHKALGLCLEVGDCFYPTFDIFPFTANSDKNWAYVFMIYEVSIPINGVVFIKCICIPKPAQINRVCESLVCEAVCC